MKGRHETTTPVRIGILLADLVLVSGSMAAFLLWNFGRGQTVKDWLPLLLVPAMQLVAYQAAGAYEVAFPGRARSWVQSAASGHLLSALLIIAGLYLAHMADEVPRLAFIAWFLGSLLLVCCCRLLVRWAWIRLLRHGDHAPKAVLVGRWQLCHEVLQRLRDDPDAELVPVGVATDDTASAAPAGLPLALVADAAALALDQGASRVLICASLDEMDQVEEALRVLEPFPLEIQLAPDLSRFPVYTLGSEVRAGMPLLNLSVSPMTPGDRLLKRLEDLVISTLVLLAIWWLLLLIAAAVKIASPGPVLYVQRRHGLMGRTIEVFKFRTMTWSPEQSPGPDDSGPRAPAIDDDATRIKAAADAFLRPPTGQFRQARPGDARITLLGRFLRATSFDELPQFWNVLMGDMSVVGPRPHARMHNLGFVDRVPGLMRRHFVKPGITGLAQISGARGRTRNVEDMGRRVALDLQYIRDWSLWLDLWIILKTLFVGFYNKEP